MRDRGKTPERKVRDDEIRMRAYLALSAAHVTGQVAIDVLAQLRNQGLTLVLTDENEENDGQSET
jgi:hypothetical protein